MIQVPSPHEMEELWRDLFSFDNRMPVLALRGSVSLRDFRVGNKRSVSKQLLLISQIAALLKKLPDEQLWALLMAVKKTDCLDANASLGNCFLSIEAVVIKVLARRLMARGLLRPNNVSEATHTILDLFDFLKDDCFSLCIVFGRPTMLVEFCCGCSSFNEERRGKRVLGFA